MKKQTSETMSSIDSMLSRTEAELRTLGINEGDTVYLRSDFRSIIPSSIGGHTRLINQILFDSLSRVVGESGGIMAPAFTHAGMVFVKRLPFFDQDVTPTSGSFSKYLVRRPDTYRSNHPTNSFVGIGPKVERILAQHNENSSAFAPVEMLIALGGKQLLIGCVDTSPGLSSVHVAQYSLGYSQKSWFAGRVKAKYTDGVGAVRVFKKTDSPGCSSGFNKMYPRYRSAGILNEGVVLGLASMVAPAWDAFLLDKSQLAEEPFSLRCDFAGCIDCGFMSYYARGNRLRFLLREAPKKIFSYTAKKLAKFRKFS